MKNTNSFIDFSVEHDEFCDVMQAEKSLRQHLHPFYGLGIDLDEMLINWGL